MNNINYTFSGYQEKQDLLYFNDCKLNTCVCYYASIFTIEGLIQKIKDRREMFAKFEIK